MNNIGMLNFLEFLSTEEQNLLTSMCNMREEFDLFFNLDEIFKEPLIRLKPKADDVAIPQLYFFVHYHMFISVSGLLRVHLSEALSSTRKAIDGALTAYELIEHPEKTSAYINGDRHFLNIKAALKKRMEKQPGAYPLATGLIGLHELCSQFGSHADFSSFAHRLQINRSETGDVEVTFDYFQKPGRVEEFKYYFLSVLHAYYQMFGIFRTYFDREFKIVEMGWEKRIATLGQELPARIAKLKRML
jgi:hypothetical protein